MKKMAKTFKRDPQFAAWVKRIASMFKEVQKQKEYARHNPPMEKRTTRFICRLGRGAHDFDSIVTERLSEEAVPLFWQLAFVVAVKEIILSNDSVTIPYLDAVIERGKSLESDKILFSRSRSRFVTALLPKVVQALTASYEAFCTDVSRFDRNVRYANNEFTFPQAKYAFRRTASALALSIRRKKA